MGCDTAKYGQVVAKSSDCGRFYLNLLFLDRASILLGNC